MEQFSSELIAILGVGVTMLGGGITVIRLVLQQGRRLDRRIDVLALHMDERDRRMDDQLGQLTDQTNERFRQLTDQTNERFRQLTDQINERFRQQNEETNERFRQLTDQMNEQFRQMNEQFRSLSERVARVEGKFDLLETFVEHRKEPPAEATE